MEQTNKLNEEPKQKTSKDFMLLFLAIGGLIAALVVLKYAISALHLL